MSLYVFLIIILLVQQTFEYFSRAIASQNPFHHVTVPLHYSARARAIYDKWNFETKEKEKTNMYLVYVDVFQLRLETLGFGSSGRSPGAATRFVFAAGLLFPSHVAAERSLDFGRGMAKFCTHKRVVTYYFT